jgi:hypothetical protein
MHRASTGTWNIHLSIFEGIENNCRLPVYATIEWRSDLNHLEVDSDYNPRPEVHINILYTLSAGSAKWSKTMPRIAHTY